MHSAQGPPADSDVAVDALTVNTTFTFAVAPTVRDEVPRTPAKKLFTRVDGSLTRNEMTLSPTVVAEGAGNELAVAEMHWLELPESGWYASADPSLQPIHAESATFS